MGCQFPQALHEGDGTGQEFRLAAGGDAGRRFEIQALGRGEDEDHDGTN